MATTHSPWFETNPHFLQRETDALAALNVDFTVDSTSRSQGILKIGLVIDPTNPAFNLPVGLEPIRIEALFPDNYPYFRPTVKALNVALPRHQDPIGKTLCLLPRPTENWDVTWTLAALLQEQLAKLLEKGTIVDADLLEADDAEQAEPVSVFYPSQPGPVVFDSSGFDALVTTESPVTQLGRIQVGLPKQSVLPARLFVVEGMDMDKRVLSQLPETLQQRFPCRFDGYVLRLAERPPHGVAEQDAQWLKGLLKKHINTELRSKPLPLGKNGVTITHIWALNIPEETSAGRMGRGWLFVIEGFIDQVIQLPKNKTTKKQVPFAYYAQVARSGAEDTQIRVPTLTGLPDFTVAVVGLGALGAPAAIEFARNQIGGLRLMDFDTIDPATTVRWPLGLTAFGQQKTVALQEFINDQYPRTKVTTVSHRIGGYRQATELPAQQSRSEQEVMDAFLDGVSLLFDASAEVGVNHFLSVEAKKRGISYISLYTTPGAWGGLIMRVVPGKTEGCWMCLQHAKYNQTIPTPVSDVAGEVQAPGCGDLTFTGASFDMQNISLAAVRLAVSTLSAATTGGYPDVAWDVGVVSLVDEAKQPIPPSWKTFPLKADPNCPYCPNVSLHD